MCARVFAVRNEGRRKAARVLSLLVAAFLAWTSVLAAPVVAENTACTLTMAVSGDGATTPKAGDHPCYCGEVVDIAASPAEGWRFDNWTGAVTDPTSANTTIMICENTTVTAAFARMEYTLAINVTGSGSVERTPEQDTHHWGDVVTLTPRPEAGWAFDGFSGDSTTNTVTMDGDKVVEALFTREEETPPPPDDLVLIMAVAGSGQTTPAVGEHSLPEGRVVDITATAAKGWHFDNWTGAVADPASAGTTVTMSDNMTVTASFSQTEYTLAINVTGSGSVERTPEQDTYHWGDVVTLTPRPEAGWALDGFSGDSTTNTITMDGDKVVEALFTREEETPPLPDDLVLIMAVAGSGQTTPAVGEHGFPEGEVVDITAIPAEGWQFDNWTGAVADPASASTTVTISENMTVMASFSLPEDTNQVPAVLCLWAQEPLAELESGDPAHGVVGCQVNPTLAYGTAKDVDYCAVVTGAEDGGGLRGVTGYVFYPADSPSPYRDGVDPDGTRSGFMCKVVFSRVDDPDEAAALVKAAVAADLVALASQEDLDGLTGANGLIARGAAELWVARGSIAYDEPGGDYAVRVWALDHDAGRSDVLEGSFNYVPTSGIEVDFTGIVYGSVDLNVESLVAGDLDWGHSPAGDGQTNKPTVRNIGNTWAHVVIQQDDMGFLMVGDETGTALVSGSPLGAASSWTVNYGVQLGGDDAFRLYCDPNVQAVTPNFLGLSAMDELQFSILVKDGHGTHYGTMTIGSTIEPFGEDGAGSSLGPVGEAGLSLEAIADS